MKAILIDAINRKIEEVHLDPSDTLHSMYRWLKVDIITTAFYLDHEDRCYVDDEGLLKKPEHFFFYNKSHQPMAGNGIIVGCDDEGNTAAPKITIEEVRKNVRFLCGFEASILAALIQRGYSNTLK